MFRKRNNRNEDTRPWRVRIADWIEQTNCDPTHPDAPCWETLDDMDREGHLQRIETAGQPTRWMLTSLGMYEISRQRAGGAPPMRWF